MTRHLPSGVQESKRNNAGAVAHCIITLGNNISFRVLKASIALTLSLELYQYKSRIENTKTTTQRHYVPKLCRSCRTSKTKSTLDSL
jgi:hypothetical protein